jgi:predicted secreted acid phosphatase
MTNHRWIAATAIALLALVPSFADSQVTQAPPPAVCPAPACTAPIASSQLQNLGQLKSEIRDYYQQGSYTSEVASVEADAGRYIDARVAAGVKRPALVLDIDDTSLLTFDYEVAHDFGFDEPTWNAAAAKGFPAIAPTLELAKHAQAKGVAVFFITGRRVPLTDVTAKNLTDAGYTYVHLYLRPVDDHAPSVVPYKSGERAAIEAAGYTVLETIGDQWSDLEGGHAERAYKLPNPMYFIP